MSNLGVMVAQLGLMINNSLTDQQMITLLNATDLEEVEARPWARLKIEHVFNSFALYTTGTVSVNQGSATVTGSGTTFTQGMEGMYFSAGGTATSSSTFAPIKIDAFISATQVNLETVWPYVSATDQGFQIFPLFYSLPGFQRCVGVRQMVPLQRRTHEKFNFWDPYRTQRTSPAVYWAPFGRDSDDNAKIELWPIETCANGYTAYGLRGHQDMQNPSDFAAIPSAVLVNKCAMTAWATLYALHGDDKMAKARDFYKTRYDDELEKAIDSDREEYGVVGRVQNYQDSDAESGDYVPGLDAIYNRDPI